MLRSTGFFRGIDCPFYSESYNGKIVKNGCNRPYCHFRHSNQRRTSYGSFEFRKTKELSSSTNGDFHFPSVNKYMYATATVQLSELFYIAMLRSMLLLYIL